LIAGMPRPRPPGLHKEISRHGKAVWYFRDGKGPRVRIRGEFGSDAFRENYEAAAAGRPAAARGGPESGSLAWLIARYRDSAAWAALAPATRRQRDNIFLHVIESAGGEPYSRITRTVIAAGLNRRRATPWAALNFLKAMRGLFRWAQEAGMIETNPTIGVRWAAGKTKGWHCWTETEIAQFEARWPVGTRERLALTILLYTGLRRGDVVKIGRQHVRDGIITYRTEKNQTVIAIPLLPELTAVIDASPTGDLAFIAAASGQPMTKKSFGNWFADACRAAGVPGRAHGLRKAGATRAVNNGATFAQLNAIFGWTGDKMASLYTRSMDRAKLARDAIDKLRR